MEYGKITFNKIFNKLNEEKYSFEKGELYLPKHLESLDKLQLDTELFYGESRIIDNETDKEFIPQKIEQLGFDFGFNSQYLMDVYDNLIHFKASVDSADFLKAYVYYIKNDTFIPVSQSDLRENYDPDKTTIKFVSELPNGLKDLLKIKKIFGIPHSISDLKSKYLENKEIEIQSTLYDSKAKLKELERTISKCIELKNQPQQCITAIAADSTASEFIHND